MSKKTTKKHKQIVYKPPPELAWAVNEDMFDYIDAVVFLDAIHYKVKQEGHIVNKAVYMVIGVDMDGNKDVLGMYIGEHETSKFWLTVLN